MFLHFIYVLYRTRRAYAWACNGWLFDRPAVVDVAGSDGPGRPGNFSNGAGLCLHLYQRFPRCPGQSRHPASTVSVDTKTSASGEQTTDKTRYKTQKWPGLPLETGLPETREGPSGNAHNKTRASQVSVGASRVPAQNRLAPSSPPGTEGVFCNPSGSQVNVGRSGGWALFWVIFGRVFGESRPQEASTGRAGVLE